MDPSEKKKPRIRFAHIFIAAAILIVPVNFTIGGFAPYFMVLIPAFPFLLLSVLPISWKFVGHSDTHGIIGTGIGALASVLPVTAIFAYDLDYVSIFCWGHIATIICGAIMKKTTHPLLNYMKSVFGYHKDFRDVPKFISSWARN